MENIGTSAHSLAHSLGYVTEADLCALCQITQTTAENWRKRHKGPKYSLVGNRVLYPLTAVREFLDSQVRERAETSAKGLL